MAFDLEVEFERTEDVACSFSKVFDVLADVPYSSQFMPRLDRLDDLGDEKYKWVMDKIGIDRWSIQSVYACEYYWDKKEGWVEWTPVEGEGNASIKGRWDLEKIDAKNTRVTFTTDGTFEMPMPKLSKALVSPLARREFESNVNEYIDNLIEHWES